MVGQSVRSVEDDMAKKLWIRWLIFVLVIGLGFCVYQFISYKAIRSDARGQLQTLATAKQQVLQTRLEEVVLSLREARDYVYSASSGANSTENINQFLDGLTQKNVTIITLLVIDAQGVSVASNRPTLIGSNFKNSPRYKAISEHPDPDKIYFSDPFLTPLGNYTIAIGSMLGNKKGGFNGYILAIASPEVFWKILVKDTATHGMASALMNDSGLVIYRTPNNENREASDLSAYPDSDFWKFLSSGKDADESTAIAPTTGLMNMISYRRIALKDITTDRQLYLALSVENNLVFQNWQTRGLRLFLAWILLVSLSGLAVVWKIQRAEI